MLVLSRKENQSIRFPHLGISVEILRVEGHRVRVGVDAPRDLRIVRGELANDEGTSKVRPNESAEAAADPESRKRMHDLRNRLNSANLAMHLLQKQLDAGLIEDAEKTLALAMSTFSQLDSLAAGDSITPKLEKSAESQPIARQRALVVDDNANERELLAGYLRLCGYEVDAVQDGIDAMLHLENQDQQPDVILLDMQMPRMDGPKTIDAIRSNPEYRDIKIFAVTGSERDALGIAVGDERGVDRWFEKPLQVESFAKVLGRECATA